MFFWRVFVALQLHWHYYTNIVAHLTALALTDILSFSQSIRYTNWHLFLVLFLTVFWVGFGNYQIAISGEPFSLGAETMLQQINWNTKKKQKLVVIHSRDYRMGLVAFRIVQTDIFVWMAWYENYLEWDNVIILAARGVDKTWSKWYKRDWQLDDIVFFG